MVMDPQHRLNGKRIHEKGEGTVSLLIRVDCVSASLLVTVILCLCNIGCGSKPSQNLWEKKQHYLYTPPIPWFFTEASVLFMWTSYINCVLVWKCFVAVSLWVWIHVKSCSSGSNHFSLHRRQADRRLDPFISFVRGNVSFLLWCGNDLEEGKSWNQPHLSRPSQEDNFTKRERTWFTSIRTERPGW